MIQQLTIFTEGPPSRGQALRWIGFFTLTPTAILAGGYTLYVGPRIRAKWAADAAGQE
jgi:hypothetical protein